MSDTVTITIEPEAAVELEKQVDWGEDPVEWIGLLVKAISTGEPVSFEVPKEPDTED